MNKEEVTLKENVIYDGKIIKVNCDEVRCPNGRTSKREVVHHRGGVCVLCEVDNKIALITQYRYAYRKELLELPAGKLEVGENPYDAGMREIEEEIGYKAESLIDMGQMYPTCGYSDEIIYLYVAKNPRKTHTNYDEDEFIDIKWYEKEELKSMVLNNEIKDGKTVILLAKYLLK